MTLGVPRGAQVALVTGGDSGIGRAVAAAFAREGAHVAICYYSHHEDARETVGLVEKEGRSAIAIVGDASEEAFAAHAVRQTLERFGKLDILVNHVGIQDLRQSITEISAKQLTETFATNVFSMCKRIATHACVLMRCVLRWRLRRRQSS